MLSSQRLNHLTNLLYSSTLIDAIQSAELLVQQRVPVKKEILVRFIKECTVQGNAEIGSRVYNLVVSNGLHSSSYICDHLIRLLATCGQLDKATNVFYQVSKPTIYTWNAIISGHVKLEKCWKAIGLYKKMQMTGIEPTKVTYIYMLQACGKLQIQIWGQLMHYEVVGNSLDTDVVLGSAVIDMYSKCSDMVDAQKVFDQLPFRNVVSWGALIAGYVQSNDAMVALKLLENMHNQNLEPDEHTLSSALKASGIMCLHNEGKFIHNMVITRGLELDSVIGNSIIDMYARCHILHDAHKVFDFLPKKSIVSWGSLISGYVQSGNGIVALDLFYKLYQLASIELSKNIFSSVFKACGMTKSIIQGKLLHQQLVSNEIELDVIIGNALIDMYAKCGNVEDAYKMFRLLPDKTAVSWGTLISAYAHNGDATHAVEMFEEMQEAGIVHDEVVLILVLKACGYLGYTESGQILHNQVVKTLADLSDEIIKALVDMYVRFSRLQEAQRMFDCLFNKDLLSWNMMITGSVNHGECLSAFKFFIDMCDEHVKPDKFIFTSSLKACTEIGTIGFGRWIHNQVVIDGLEFDIVIGSALVDMYIHCESLEEAYQVFNMLPSKNEVSWGAIVDGYAQSGNCIKVNELLEKMYVQGIRPNDIIMTSVLDACSHSGLLDKGLRYFNLMQDGWPPSIEEYSCIIDLLGRLGHFFNANDVLGTMPMQPDSFTSASLLTGGRTYGNSKSWQF